MDREKAAVRILNAVGRLMYEKERGAGVLPEPPARRHHLRGDDLFDYAEKVVRKPIDIYASADIAEAMLEMDLALPRSTSGA